MPSNDDIYGAPFWRRYCPDSCTPEERAPHDGDPDRLARVAPLCCEDAALLKMFAAAAHTSTTTDARPAPQELIAYVDGTLAASRRRFVEEWAGRDPEIEAEIRLLRRLGRNPLTDANGR